MVVPLIVTLAEIYCSSDALSSIFCHSASSASMDSDMILSLSISSAYPRSVAFVAFVSVVAVVAAFPDSAGRVLSAPFAKQPVINTAHNAIMPISFFDEFMFVAPPCLYHRGATFNES
ncbi:hypothetical protein D3C85_1453780 [compost metagenome]